MNVHVLVTGGAGYLGSILVPDLLGLGYEVTVIDNFMYGQNSLAHLCHYPLFTVINGDVRDETTISPLLKKSDIIIPLAAYVGAPLCSRDTVGAMSTNRDAILMMLKKLSKDQWIIMPTTNSAYGKGDPHKNGFCDEGSQLQPLSLYAKTKVEVESALMEHENAVSLRLATVFGMSARMRIDLLVNDFTYRAYKDRFVVLFEGHFKRNYIHIRDVSRGFSHCISHFQDMRGEVYNLGLSSSNLSKAELCQIIQKYIPDFVYMEAPIGKDPDQRDYLVSNEKVEKTGYSPTYSLDFGIQELIKGYKMINNKRFGNA